MAKTWDLNPDRVGRDRMQEVSFDPFKLMPRAIPPHPRLFVTPRVLNRAKRLVRRARWAASAMNWLLSSVRESAVLPRTLPTPSQPAVNDRVLGFAMRCALAHLLTGESGLRERSLEALRLLARHYPRWPINESHARGATYSLAETRFIAQMAQTYDMLAADGLSSEDERLFRAALDSALEVVNVQPHMSCGNHNTWCLFSRLAIAVALGDLQGIHDALYGWQSGPNGRGCPAAYGYPPGSMGWRYGVVHQLRHDILSDGLHWERAPGYHFYTMMGFSEIAWLCANIGVDLWRARLPTQTAQDCGDLHRAYGPAGRTKSLKAMFDAPFYLAFANGDLSMIHDSGVANLRGVWIWETMYDLAYQEYGDPKYAWLLNKIERDYPTRKRPELPMSLQGPRGNIDFVRLDGTVREAGAFSLARPAAISLLGRHRGGCTLFPVTGVAVLRSNPADVSAPGVYIFYGPHSAGHQSPGALHIELHAGGERLTDAPHSAGYEDPTHLTWVRTTIAHNTVTVDETPMYPYDAGGDSIWEKDWERIPGRVSDGKLELFKPAGAVKAVRASNENVYPGVRLDRTVLLTRDFVIDVYRVLSRKRHRYDWAMHCVGTAHVPRGAARVDLGDALGYRHFTHARELRLGGGIASICWKRGEDTTVGQIAVPAGARLILARDPQAGKGQWFGQLAPVMPRTTAMVRANGEDVVFVSLWQRTPAKGKAAELWEVQGRPRGQLTIRIRAGERTTAFRLPMRPPAVKVGD
jgi:hypothetical protein